MKNQDIFFKKNPIPMWVFNRQTLKIKAVNQAALKLYGYSEDELLELTIKDLRKKKDIPKLLNEINKAIPKYNDAGVWEHVNKRGETVYVHIVSSPIEWEGEDCKLVVAQNVSYQKEIDQLIFDDEGLFESLIQNFPGIFILLNKENEVIRWNENALKLSGYTAEEFKNLNIYKLSSPEEHKNVKQFLTNAYKEGLTEIDSKLLTKSGETLPILLKASKVFISGEPHILSIGVNIKALKEVESRLSSMLLNEKEERERIEIINNRLSLIEKVNQIFTKEQVLNDALNKITDLLVHEVADTCSINLIRDGKPYRAAYSVASEEIAKKATIIDEISPNTLFSSKGFNYVLENGEPYYKQSISDEELQSVAVNDEHYKSLKDLQLKSYFLLPLKVGKRKLGIFSLILLKGNKKFYADDKTFLMELADKMSLYIDNFLVNNDLKNLNANLEKIVQERTKLLELANKELESFSYSVSHDLRAPLRAITGYSNFLIEDHLHNLNEEGQEFLQILYDETRRMGILIDDLLAFSRMSRTEKQEHRFSMQVLVKDVIQELKFNYPNESPEFIVGALPDVTADSTLIKQVWVNILSNAIKYKKEGQQQLIHINSEYDKDGENHVFSIQDNGVGFDMKYSDKLFEVFQRLHSDDEFEGTGIGLALAQRIIYRHDGRIWAESKKGEGSTFYFSLPIKQKKKV